MKFLRINQLLLAILFTFSTCKKNDNIQSVIESNASANSKRKQGNSDFGLSHKRVCPEASKPGMVECDCHVIIGPDGKPQKNYSPLGYGPADLHAAYIAQATTTDKKIIAIVDAYDHPDIYNDLTVYSRQFGLPVLPECTGPISGSNVPCFKKIDQRDGTSYPVPNSSWGLEIALDVEIAHVSCNAIF